MLDFCRRAPRLLLYLGLLLATAREAAAEDLRISPPVASIAAPGAAAHDYPFFSTNRRLADDGYVETEVFVEGEATGYSTSYGSEVVTGLRTGDHAAFRTRLVVRRPKDVRKFNGVVVVEWLNVSNRFEADNVWLATQDHLVRKGYAWVGVAAQGFGGVESLKAWAPARYGALRIDNGGQMTAEPYSIDIYRQVGSALRTAPGQALLGGAAPRTLIAAGQSQSAIWLASLINGGWAKDAAYDGYLLVSATGTQVDPAVARPVLRLVAEGDAEAADAGPQSPDGPRFRQWEVAGTSHVDRRLRAAREPLQLRDMAVSVQAQIAPSCARPQIGTTTSMFAVLDAGLDALVRWAQGGAAPPVAPRLTRATSRPGVERDARGFALGGIRLPEVAAPLGLNVGSNAGGAGCASQGYFTPYDAAALAARYPKFRDYLAAVDRSVRDNIRAGFMLKADGDVIRAKARAAPRW